MNRYFLKQRHDDIAAEMLRRGMKHNTPIDKLPDMSYLEDVINWQIDQQDAEWNLILRCAKCREGLRKLNPNAFNIKQYNDITEKINNQ